MTPEAPRGSLVLLDLEMNNSVLGCIVESFDPEPRGDEFLRVSWNATQSPPGYVPIGGGVAFVWRPSGGYTYRTYPAIPTVMENDRFSWKYPVYGDVLMLIIVLPPDYMLPSVDDADPAPIASKVFKGRMALYWLVKRNSNNEAEVIWHIRHAETQDIARYSSLLNDEAYRRRRTEPLNEVIIDEQTNKNGKPTIDFRPQVDVEIKPYFTQGTDVKVETRVETNVDINLKIDLQTIQSDFENLKDILIKTNPGLERNLIEIGDNLDEVSANTEKEKLYKPFNKLGRFLKNLGDENSDIHKIIMGTKKGVEYAQKLGKTFNKFAQWLAIPQVPDLLLGK